MHFVVPKGYSQEDLIYYFESMATPHGTSYDDGRRWCANCEHIQTPTKFACDNPAEEWLNKSCFFCHAVWPEFLQELSESDPETEYFAEQYESATIN